MTGMYVSNEAASLLDVSFFYLFCNPTLRARETWLRALERVVTGRRRGGCLV